MIGLYKYKKYDTIWTDISHIVKFGKDRFKINNLYKVRN